MESKTDRANMLDQMNNLKSHNDKFKECLTSIQLLMVDGNNSRVKDAALADELTNLTSQVDSISASINAIEKQLI